MKRANQAGAISGAVIVAVTMTLLFIGASIFAVTAVSTGQDYKNNVTQKVDAAVEVAKKQTETTKDNEFAEASKSPVKTFQGSATYGSVSFDYPKTYSAYVVQKDSDTTPIDGYFQPNVVPDVTDSSVAFALRVQVVGQSYDSVLKTFDSYIKTGKATATPFRAVKTPQTLGTAIQGSLSSAKSGTMVILPLRDKTIEIWTESADYKNDFVKYVLPSISFVP